MIQQVLPLPGAKPLPDQIHEGHRRIACASHGSIRKTRDEVKDRMTDRLKDEMRAKGLWPVTA